jgi:hypothetical protein
VLLITGLIKRVSSLPWLADLILLLIYIHPEQSTSAIFAAAGIMAHLMARNKKRELCSN